MSLKLKGWNKDLVIYDSKSIELSDFLCGICHEICRDAVEITCAQHLERHSYFDESTLFCQMCLTSHLTIHNNACPNNNTESNQHMCTYHASPFIRKCVLRFDAKCPNHRCKWQGTLNV